MSEVFLIYQVWYRKMGVVHGDVMDYGFPVVVLSILIYMKKAVVRKNLLHPMY
jgi:hypothetical protein